MLEKTDTITLLLASDNMFLRRGLKEVLSESRGFVVHERDSVEEAFSAIRELLPQGVIIDLDFRPPSGIELAARIRRHWPVVFVVTLASRSDDEELYASIRAGCAAYLLKSIEAEEMVSSMQRAYRGEYPINETVNDNPRIASRILGEFQNFALSAGETLSDLIVPLNPRELDILQHVAHGNTNKRIAVLLGIKEQSVKNYISGILRKVAANDRAHAVFLAIKHGWLKAE